jgi:hypothetical protein
MQSVQAFGKFFVCNGHATVTGSIAKILGKLLIKKEKNTIRSLNSVFSRPLICSPVWCMNHRFGARLADFVCKTVIFERTIPVHNLHPPCHEDSCHQPQHL